MARRRPNPRSIKINRSYAVEEAAKALGAHKNTVRGWIKQGLPVFASQRPVLILGSDLRAFLNGRRNRARRPCAPGTIYCFKCRAPSRPALGMVDYVPHSVTGGNLKALCEVCATIMHQRIGRAAIARKMPGIDVLVADLLSGAEPRLTGSALSPLIVTNERTGFPMPKPNERNARIKRVYFRYLREAMRRDEKTIDVVARALVQFEEATRHRDFAAFHQEQAVAFKRRLAERVSKATAHATLAALKAFFHWLAGRPGYRSKPTYSDADYFNLPANEVRIAKASLPKPFPTLAQVHHVLAAMPAETPAEPRDRALIACAILTGARDGALRSLRLKHVHLIEQRIDQDAREVATKNAKSQATWFFPVGGEALAILTGWCEELRNEMLWSDCDPLFPATAVAPDASGAFAPAGLLREGWRSTGPVRQVFRRAFEGAGLPYFHPHSLRHTLGQHGERTCRTIEEFKAWSQNLGHSGVLTTLTSYGSVASHRQAELIRAMAAGSPSQAIDPDAVILARALLAKVA